MFLDAHGRRISVPEPHMLQGALETLPGKPSKSARSKDDDITRGNITVLSYPVHPNLMRVCPRDPQPCLSDRPTCRIFPTSSGIIPSYCCGCSLSSLASNAPQGSPCSAMLQPLHGLPQPSPEILAHIQARSQSCLPSLPLSILWYFWTLESLQGHLSSVCLFLR